MAYAVRQGNERYATIAAVAAIHAAIGLALIVGLAPPLIDIIRPGKTTVFNVPVPKPSDPPPEADPKPHQDTSTVTAPRPPIDFPTANNDTEVKLPQDDPTIDVVPTATPTATPSPGPTAQPGPAFTPRHPRPANDQSRWVTTAEYPSADIRGGHEGTTQFRLVVSSQGKVQSCEVVQSSGWPGLDAATCKYVSRRAKFEPGTNDRGEQVVDTYVGRVVWRLPKD